MTKNIETMLRKTHALPDSAIQPLWKMLDHKLRRLLPLLRRGVKAASRALAEICLNGQAVTINKSVEARIVIEPDARMKSCAIGLLPNLLPQAMRHLIPGHLS